MTKEQAHHFAENWVRNFNAREVDSILAAFAEDAKFTSPRAAAVTGRPTLNSRRELGEYWRKALQSIKSVHFALDHVICDEPARRLTIVYLSEVDGKACAPPSFLNSMTKCR